MLREVPGKHYTYKYNDYHTTSYSLPLTIEEVEQFIHSSFNSSSAKGATAALYDWCEFLKENNELGDGYILTQDQLKDLQMHYEHNQDLQMTPEEFVNLLSDIKRVGQKKVERKYRSSNFNNKHSGSTTTSSGGSARPISYYNDRASMNHPDSTISPSAYERLRKSGFKDNEQEEDYGQQPSFRQLERERDSLKRQVQQCDKKMMDLSRQHSERTSHLQAKIDYLKEEINEQRVLVNEQKTKEKERLEMITELNNANQRLEAKNTSIRKKLQKKEEEVENYQYQITQLEDVRKEDLNKVKSLNSLLSQTKTVLHTREKEIGELQLELDQKKRRIEKVEEDLESQRQENTKLMELVDRQKFDLDEARSGLEHFEKQRDYEREKLEYMKQLAALEKERDDYRDQLTSVKEKLASSSKDIATSHQLQEIQRQKYQKLSLQFDEQHRLIDIIQSNLSTHYFRNPSKLFALLSLIPWAFFLYHIGLILLYYFFPNPHGLLPYQGYPLFILNYIDEWLLKRS